MTKPTPPLLRTLRETKVLVIHPPDRDGEELVRQLRRIGCDVRSAWPQPARIEASVDVVFLLLERTRTIDIVEPDTTPPFALVAIVDYEDPFILNQMIDAHARGVVTKPIRPFGVLATLVTARAANRYEHRLAQKLRKLEENLRSRREIEKGIRILMNMQGLSEEAAYRLMQQRAMELRQSVAAVAGSILSAHALFAGPKAAPDRVRRA